MDNQIWRKNETTLNFQGKTIFYNDRFFTGPSDDPFVFVATVKRNTDFNNIDFYLRMSFVGEEGVIMTFDLNNETQRAEAVATVNRLSEALANLASVLKKGCDSNDE